MSPSNLHLTVSRHPAQTHEPTIDLVIPIIFAFIAVIFGTIFQIIFPSASSHGADKDFQSTSYEYLPVGEHYVSVIAHSAKQTAGTTTRHTSVKTFYQGVKQPYSLRQILRDGTTISDLLPTPPATDILDATFAVDAASQELLVVGADGAEQRVKFEDLASRLSFAFSLPMFGINPFSHKNPDNIDCSASKCLALTFDDGPSTHTDRLLDILSYSHAKATFFVLGNRVWSFSGQIARMSQEGHDVGSHSWAHKNLQTLSYGSIYADLSDSVSTIQAASGEPVRFFRPPYGNSNQNVRDINATLGQRIVLWDIDTLDWQNKDANRICNHVINNAAPNRVILLHDIYGTSVDAAQCILNNLSSEYTFVNLSTLYK